MGTCTTCGGAGQVPSGQYESCYSCGGSGHGSYTNVPCMACNGSGHSSSQRYNICWNCHGAGSTPDPKPEAPAKKSKPGKQPTSSTSNANTATPIAKKPNNLSQNIAQIAVVLAIIIVAAASDNLNGAELIFAGLGLFFASYIAIYILYYVMVAAIELLKIALVIAAVVLVIFVIFGVFNDSKAETIGHSITVAQLLETSK